VPDVPRPLGARSIRGWPLSRSLALLGTTLVGSTSIIVGEVIASASPTEAAPTASTTRGGLCTFESATGSEVAILSTVPHGGVAVSASSASASPTTCGSGDLVREGEDGIL
jgi:hypothetical protein